MSMERYTELSSNLALDQILITIAIGSETGIATWLERKEQKGYECDKKEMISKEGKRMLVISVKKNVTKKKKEVLESEVVLTLEDADMILTGNNRGFKKFFVFTVAKMGQQLHNGKIPKGSDGVKLRAKELVENGMFTTVDKAMRAIEEYVTRLQLTILKGTILIDGRKAKLQGQLVGSLIHIKNTDEYIIKWNRDFNYRVLAKPYMDLPSFFYRLSSNGADTLYTIFYFLRMNVDEIKKKGCIRISFKTFQERLGLPEADQYNTSTKKTIKDPILDSFAEIQKMQELEGVNNFQLRPVYKSTRIKDFLEEGYLEVTAMDELKERCEERADAKSEAIQKKNDQKERIIEQARILALAKKFKQEEEQMLGSDLL